MRPSSATRPSDQGNLELLNLDILDVTTPIAVTAARLRGEYKFNTPDALHAATALYAKANTLITNDRDFLRLESAGLRIALLE